MRFSDLTNSGKIDTYENYLMASLQRSIIVARRYLYASFVRCDILQIDIRSIFKEFWLS